MLVVVLEAENALGDFVLGSEVSGREGFALEDREVDLDLVEPAGVLGQMYEGEFGEPGLEPVGGTLAAMDGAVVDDPEDALGRTVGIRGHHLGDERVEGDDGDLAANYWISFFGQPGDAAWGWLINGHHMAASFTVVGDRVAFTPLFLGAEPHEIERGLEAGWRVLANEGERGWRLLQALNEDQRTVAVLAGEIPFDVLSGPGRKGSLSEFSGIRMSSLTEAQQALLWELVEEFAANADHAAADAQLEKIRADGLDALHFAWIGPTDDRTARYYYRVHGPSVLIEYIVEEGVGGNAANHVHSIMRDPGNDYGEDWLGKHYEEHHRRR